MRLARKQNTVECFEAGECFWSPTPALRSVKEFPFYRALSSCCLSNLDGDDTKWYPFEGHTYQVFGEVGRPRDDGSVVCEENQAYLVSFNSSAEVRFIERILRKNDYERPALWWYIGAYIDAGEWRWEDGSSE